MQLNELNAGPMLLTVAAILLTGCGATMGAGEAGCQLSPAQQCPRLCQRGLGVTGLQTQMTMSRALKHTYASGRG
jgi:hypothetical protein